MNEHRHHNDHTASRVATGIKTALLVCVIGFIALAANRALVAPAASVADVPAAAASVSDGNPSATSTVDPSIAGIPAPAYDATSEYDGGDNHPPTF
jgi:hypothetical protein